MSDQSTIDAPSQTATVPSHQELVGRAEKLRTVLRSRSAATESDREIPQQTIDDLATAGFFRMNVPRELGGYGVSSRTLSEVLAILAAGDASTAWVVGVYSGGAAGIDHKSAELVAELTANGPDLKICGSGTPSKDVTRVEGGYRVSGRWFSVSGSAHADWASLFLILPGGGMGQASVPLSDLTIDHTWNATGMRATESDTVVATELFVPEHRVTVMDGPPPPNPILSVGPCAIPVGIAQGMLDRAVESAMAKPLAGTTFQHAAESTSFQVEMADAAMRIDSARLHLFRALDTIDASRISGEPMDELTRARCRGDAGWIMKNIIDAIEQIMTAVGSGAFAESSPFERAWRDVSTMSRHGATNYMINREVFGKVLLGQDGNISRLPV